MGKELLSGPHSQGAEGFVATTGTYLGELPVPLGQSQDGTCVCVCVRGFLHWNTPEPQGKGQSSEPDLKLLEFSLPRRFSKPMEKPVLQLAFRSTSALHCSHLPSLRCRS